MNVINTTCTSTSTDTGAIKFGSLALEDHGLTLKFGKKQERKVSFSELDKIYIKVYKLNPAYRYLFILVPFLLAFLFFEYIKLDIEMFVALVPVIPVFAKINFYKRYGLVIRLKDGTFYRKKVSKKLKSDHIDLINEVKRERLKYIEMDTASQPIDFPMLRHEMAS